MGINNFFSLGSTLLLFLFHRPLLKSLSSNDNVVVHCYVIPSTFVSTKQRIFLDQRSFSNHNKNSIIFSKDILTVTDSATTSTTSLHVIPVSQQIAAASAISNTPDTSALWIYFWQAVISNGVPALFTIFVIGFAAFQFRPRKDKDSKSGGMMRMSNMFMSEDDLSNTNPVALLYDDLYGDQDQDPLRNKDRNGFFGPFGNPNKKQKQLAKNTGIPSQQYIKVTNMNQKYDSFKFSIQSATNSKVMAATQYKQTALQRALGKATADVDLVTWQELQKVEQEFLKSATELTTEIQHYQSQLTASAIFDELGMNEKEFMNRIVDPMSKTKTIITNSSSNTTANSTTNLNVQSSTKRALQPKGYLWNALTKAQKELQETELDFIQNVVHILGPEKSKGVLVAFLGSSGTSLFSSSQNGERPLVQLFGNHGVTSGSSNRPNKKLYVMNFPGDVTASQVSDLREVITAIVVAQKASGNDNKDDPDEALVVLQSGGGTVTGYGLAAAQLMRLKEQAGLKLTICVEQVAASGGYMMACIADKIIASPFAVLGSIGVISDIPNVYERLKQEGIEFQTVTAGKYKRTLTPTKKVTKEDYDKSKRDIEEIYALFRDFVKTNRPQLDIDKVATGETWFGTDALERNLCDEINTVDDVLTDYVAAGYDVYKVEYKPPVEETAFGRLLRSSASSSSSSSFGTISGNTDISPLEQPIRWFIRTIANAITEEISSVATSNMEVPIEKRYMAVDDAADRIRASAGNSNQDR